MPITILELAVHRGAREVDGRINGGEFFRVGLDIMGGCGGGCQSTLAAYNAYPSRRGFWMCADCVGDSGYATVEEANDDIFGGVMPVDSVTHVFRTLMGIPPTKDDPPLCGAVLTDAYDFPGVDRPPCPSCTQLKEAKP